jgi:hypothetical protein
MRRTTGAWTPPLPLSRRTRSADFVASTNTERGSDCLGSLSRPCLLTPVGGQGLPHARSCHPVDGRTSRVLLPVAALANRDRMRRHTTENHPEQLICARRSAHGAPLSAVTSWHESTW